jgi:large subunit ribosomal protein L25
MELTAQKRTLTGHKLKKLRAAGKIPATVYGKKVASVNLEINEKDFIKAHAAAGDTKLIDLLVDKEKALPVLIHQVQLHPINNNVLSVDFLAVDLKAVVRVHVPITAVGNSPAVADRLGALLNPIQQLEIECLPTDLPEKLEVDISGLKEVGNAVKVSDVKVSDKIKVITPVDQVVFTIAELVQKEKVEEVITPTEVEATAEKKPEEGEEVAETKEGEKGGEKKSETKKEEKKEEKK